MKKKIIYGLLFAVAMVTASSSFVSCKDYEGDDYAGLKEQMLTNSQTTIDELIRVQQASIQYQLDNLLDALIRAKLSTSQVDAYQAQLNALMAKYNPDMSLEDKMALLSEMNKLLMQVDGVSDNNGVPSATESIIIMWGDSLKTAYEKAFSAYNLASDADALSKNNKYRLDTLSNRADSLFNVANHIADSALQVAYNNIVNNLLAKMDSTHKADIAALDSAYKAGDSLLTVRINDLEKAYKLADSLLQDQINTLNEEVAELQQDVNNILKTMKKQVTGIIVQGTYSPVFGSGSLPLGIQTNILAAYASKAAVSAEVSFPSNVSADYVNNKATLTAKDLEFAQKFVSYKDVTVQPNQLLISEAADNAGKMYLTVNPTNIDFEGTQFTLVNSKGDECKVELSALKPSEEVLKFGWTRATIDAASENGFYEVNAKISKDNALKMQPEIDKAGFKDAVKAAVDGQKRMAAKEIARALFNSLQPVQRFGVKAEWTDTLGQRSYTSAYDVAAFTLEPLGFGFKVPSGKGTRIPTIDKKLIADELHINLTVEPLVVTEFDKATGKYVFLVQIPSMLLEGYVYNETFTYQGYRIYYNADSNGFVYMDMTPLFEQMYGDFNAALQSNFDNANASINKRLDDIAAAINSYVDNANSWINRVNNLIDRLGDAVQPVLLWSDGKNAGELGGFVSANYAVGTAVKAGKEIALVPTSYSLELFAPAYKKSLLVTNAYKGGFSAQSAAGKASGLVDAVKTFSEQFKDYAVFEGNAFAPIAVKADSSLKGITFEIAYTAMDYEGKIAGRKFYLTVVE